VITGLETGSTSIPKKGKTLGVKNIPFPNLRNVSKEASSGIDDRESKQSLKE